jgi:hypothetical protein
VMPHIAADDLRHLIRIDPRWRVLFCHRVLPDFWTTLAVIDELALRSAIIPRWMFFNQQNSAEFSHAPYEMVSCSRSQSSEIASHLLKKTLQAKRS